MDPNFENHAIIDPDKLDDYMDKYDVSNILNLNDKLLISFIDNQKIDKDKFSNFTSGNINVSIPIAPTITAHAKIFMSQFKNNPEFCLYTDTGSFFFNRKLP